MDHLFISRGKTNTNKTCVVPLSTMSFIAAHPTATPPAALYETEETHGSITPGLTTPAGREVIYALFTSESISTTTQMPMPHTARRPGTPFTKCISSVHLPDNQSHKTRDQLHSLLSLDLTGQDDSILNEVGDLFITFLIMKTYVN
jgi:hypothetical protein